jgi:hypothetical protein
LIRQLDNLLKRIKAYVAEQHRDADGTWELDFHQYGRSDEPNGITSGKPLPEVFLIGEALASSQELATSVAATAKIATTVKSKPISRTHGLQLKADYGGAAWELRGAKGHFW